MNLSDMQLVCNMITEKPVFVNRNNRWTNSVARIRGKQRYIVVAEFIFNYPEELQLAEIIHESVHHLASCGCTLQHGDTFKKEETYWLNQFGLKPLFYKRAYYKALRLWSGKVIKTRSSEYNTYDGYSEQQSLRAKARKLRKKKQTERIEL